MDIEDVRRRTGATLRQILTDAGLSQADLGEAIGVTQKAVSAYIRGQRLMSIVHALGVDACVGWEPGDFLLEAGVIAPSVTRVAAKDGALDDTARAALTADYARHIAETAERRRAALTGAPAGPEGAQRVLRLDGHSADPQLVALFIANMFGPAALPTIAGQLALIATGTGTTPDAERAPDATSEAPGAPTAETP